MIGFLSESYFQFSDHYLRVLNEKENQNSLSHEKNKSNNENSSEIKQEKLMKNSN